MCLRIQIHLLLHIQVMFNDLVSETCLSVFLLLNHTGEQASSYSHWRP